MQSKFSRGAMEQLWLGFWSALVMLDLDLFRQCLHGLITISRNTANIKLIWNELMVNPVSFCLLLSVLM